MEPSISQARSTELTYPLRFLASIGEGATMDRPDLAQAEPAEPDRPRRAPARQTATGRTLLLLDSAKRVSYLDRALILWPRLDRRALRRCDHDPRRMAGYIARRTSLPLESIVSMLTAGGPAE